MRKLQYPGSAFYELNKNTVEFHGQPTDFIERHYHRMESILGGLFKLIRNDTSSDTLFKPHGIYLLKSHIATQFWRLPRFDEFSGQYLRTRTLTEIEHFCTIAKLPLPSQKVFELIQSDTGFRHFFRCFTLPLCTFDLSRSIPDSMKWLILNVEKPSEWPNFLCSDSPFIFDSPEKLFEFSGPFIFPLSNTKLLVSTPQTNTAVSYDPLMSTKISLLLYLQARKYVAASNRSFLEQIIEFSEAYVGMDGIIRLQSEVLTYVD